MCQHPEVLQLVLPKTWSLLCLSPYKYLSFSEVIFYSIGSEFGKLAQESLSHWYRSIQKNYIIVILCSEAVKEKKFFLKIVFNFPTQFPPDNKAELLPNTPMKSANCLLSFQDKFTRSLCLQLTGDDIEASVICFFALQTPVCSTITCHRVMRSRLTTDRTTEYKRCVVLSLCGGVVWSERSCLFCAPSCWWMVSRWRISGWLPACECFFFFLTRTPVYDSHFMPSV